jgi:hypothetical protein
MAHVIETATRAREVLKLIIRPTTICILIMQM